MQTTTLITALLASLPYSSGQVLPVRNREAAQANGSPNAIFPSAIAAADSWNLRSKVYANGGNLQEKKRSSIKFANLANSGSNRALNSFGGQEGKLDTVNGSGKAQTGNTGLKTGTANTGAKNDGAPLVIIIEGTPNAAQGGAGTAQTITVTSPGTTTTISVGTVRTEGSSAATTNVIQGTGTLQSNGACDCSCDCAAFDVNFPGQLGSMPRPADVSAGSSGGSSGAFGGMGGSLSQAGSIAASSPSTTSASVVGSSSIAVGLSSVPVVPGSAATSTSQTDSLSTLGLGSIAISETAPIPPAAASSTPPAFPANPPPPTTSASVPSSSAAPLPSEAETIITTSNITPGLGTLSVAVAGSPAPSTTPTAATTAAAAAGGTESPSFTLGAGSIAVSPATPLPAQVTALPAVVAGQSINSEVTFQLSLRDAVATGT